MRPLALLLVAAALRPSALRSSSACRSVALSLCLTLCLALCSGCSTTDRGGLFGWWTARGERAAEKAQAKAAAAEADLLATVQRNVEEFVAALRLAPPSRPVDVAREAAGQASAHLALLRGPLTAARLAQIEARAAALTSDDPAARAPAEAARAAERKDDAATAAELITLRRDLAAARERADAVAADNAAYAAKYLNMRLAAIAGAAGTLLLGLAAVALKLNLGGANAALADILATLRAKAPAAAPIATAAADAALSRGQQTQIFKLVTALLAQRQDASPHA